MSDVIDTLPTPPDGSAETWPLPTLLDQTARQGLVQLHRIIGQPLKLKERPEDELSAAELKLQRTIGDLSVSAGKLLARVGEDRLRERRNDDMRELWAAIEKYQAKGEANAALASDKANIVIDQ